MAFVMDGVQRLEINPPSSSHYSLSQQLTVTIYVIQGARVYSYIYMWLF